MSDHNEPAKDHTDAPDTAQTPGLTDDDAQALDALIEAGYEIDAVPEPMRDRAERVASLLGLLESPHDTAKSNPLLASATSVIAPKAAAALEPGVADPRLTAPDADAFDALIESGWDASLTPGLFRKRAVRIERMLSLLNPTGLEDAQNESLVERTFRMVELSRAKDRRNRSTEHMRIRSRYTLRDLASVAAMMLIASAIGWPLVTNLREGASQSQCTTNLNAAGLGFTLYANDHKGQLPRAPRILSQTPSGVWWHVGQGRSNSANLFVLASEGYCSIGHLACPGNHDAPTGLDPTQLRDWREPEEVSFSYIIPGSRTQRWAGSATVVVLADRSPVIERARMGERFDPEARSRNHKGRGQSVLFNDGSVAWLVTPVLKNGDNIWLPGSIEGQDEMRLSGTERPTGTGDSFVGP